MNADGDMYEVWKMAGKLELIRDIFSATRKVDGRGEKFNAMMDVLEKNMKILDKAYVDLKY